MLNDEFACSELASSQPDVAYCNIASGSLCQRVILFSMQKHRCKKGFQRGRNSSLNNFGPEGAKDTALPSFV